MTDELITNLAKIRSLHVISRTSVLRYRGTHKPVSEIARELGVDGIVEGISFAPGAKSASRRSSFRRPRTSTYGQRNMIATRRTFWHYRPKSLAESRKAFTSALLLGNNPNSLAHPPLIPPSRSCTGKAFYFINKTTLPDFKRADEYFQQMLQKDPLSARAWTGVAMAPIILGCGERSMHFPRAKTAALKAISLDDSLAEATPKLGMLSYVYDWKHCWKQSVSFVAPSISNPNYARTHIYYALMLSHTGHSQEGIEEIERARRLDPLVFPLPSVSPATYISPSESTMTLYARCSSRCK